MLKIIDQIVQNYWSNCSKLLIIFFKIFDLIVQNNRSNCSKKLMILFKIIDQNYCSKLFKVKQTLSNLNKNVPSFAKFIKAEENWMKTLMVWNRHSLVKIFYIRKEDWTKKEILKEHSLQPMLQISFNLGLWSAISYGRQS